MGQGGAPRSYPRISSQALLPMKVTAGNSMLLLGHILILLGGVYLLVGQVRALLFLLHTLPPCCTWLPAHPGANLELLSEGGNHSPFIYKVEP